MKTPALVIMAAGMGSRYGGLKQMDPIDELGNSILHYSVYDAVKAGFRDIVFVIRKEHEEDFRLLVTDRLEGKCNCLFAFQDILDCPESFRIPEGRVKPWGTGHAVLAVRGIVHEPFLVINADDYYGKEGFRRIHDYMVHEMDENAEYIDMCMGGFMLKNTLSENGGVARGVCEVREDGTLARVTETYNIRRTEHGMEATDAEGNPVAVREDQHVSMNMWGLTPRFLDVLAEGFPKFLDGLSEEGRKKAEYLLPAMIDEQIQNGTGRVRVLETPDRWFGVTYKEDRESVTAAFARLIAEGVYPEKLYS